MMSSRMDGEISWGIRYFTGYLDQFSRDDVITYSRQASICQEIQIDFRTFFYGDIG